MTKLLQGLKDKFARERFSFGLDIGSRQVKIVKLKSFKDTLTLCGFEVVPVQLDLGEVLKKLKHSQDASSVNIGVSGPSTVIRYIEFPSMSKPELKQALRFEAQKHIPFTMSEVIIDGHILRENLADNKMLVLLAAVKKDLIHSRLKVMEGTGLRVNVIDIDSISLINVFNRIHAQSEGVKNKVVGLLNIGATLCSLNILEDGILRLSRDIHIAGNNFTQKIADTFGIDFKAAEELKLNPDPERSDKVATSIEVVLANLAGEVRVSFDYFESQSASSVSKIFVSGGGSQSKGLKEMLCALLGIDVGYWDPLEQITLSSILDADKVKSLSPQLAVAVGLALRE